MANGACFKYIAKIYASLARKVAVLPLSKKLSEKADEVYSDLIKAFPVDYDESGSIGKRYRRQDEVGTPFCITVDFETLGEEGDPALKDTVTIRHRDSMEQERLAIKDLLPWLLKKIH